MSNIKKWLPAIATLGLILIIIFISLICKSKLPNFKIEESEIDIKEINKIISMLDSDDTKSKANDALNELYKDHIMDDTYYLTSAKIIMANDNDIYAVGTLRNVKNKTDEYYYLMIRATSGAFFTMGEVPNDLLDTAIEAANNYANNIDFQLLAGKLYYDKDNYTAALYYLDKALQIDSSNVDANYYYGLSIYLLGENEEGISYMEEAKRLYKGEDEAYKEAMDNYITLMKEGKR